MKIKNLNPYMTLEELNNEIENGARFVIFTYTFSIIFLTIRRPTKDIYFVKNEELPIKYGYPFLLISILFGWWGIPFGLIYTPMSIYDAFCGKDVTEEVYNSLYEAMVQPTT